MTNVEQFPLYHPSTKGSNGQGSYGVTMHKPTGPFHPHNKTALVCVTRGCIFRMLYQQADGRWSEVRTELESLNSSNDALTHASFCSHQGSRHASI